MPEDTADLRPAYAYAVRLQRISLVLAIVLPLAYGAFALSSYLAEGLSLENAFQELVREVQAWIIFIAFLGVELFVLYRASGSRKLIREALASSDEA